MSNTDDNLYYYIWLREFSSNHWIKFNIGYDKFEDCLALIRDSKKFDNMENASYYYKITKGTDLIYIDI